MYGLKDSLWDARLTGGHHCLRHHPRCRRYVARLSQRTVGLPREHCLLASWGWRRVSEKNDGCVGEGVVSPDVKEPLEGREGVLLYVDLSSTVERGGRQGKRLGGSALAQALGWDEDQGPDVTDVHRLRQGLEAVQVRQLFNQHKKLLLDWRSNASSHGLRRSSRRRVLWVCRTW